MKKQRRFLAVFTLLFGACSVQRYSDAAMFCRRFNSEYKIHCSISKMLV